MTVLIFSVSYIQAKKNTSVPSASVTFVSGKVYRSKIKKGPWKKLYAKSVVRRNEYIKTGKESRLEITLKDKSLLRISSDSMIKLTQMYIPNNEIKSAKKVGVKIFIGKLWSKVKSMSNKKSKFQITTENAVAGVRGTTFRVDVNKDNSGLVKVYTGAVAVSNSPVYARKHKKGKRVQVSGPQMVTKKKWEEFVAKEMQMIQFSATGELSKPTAFAKADDLDDWVKWNLERDKNGKH